MIFFDSRSIIERMKQLEKIADDKNLAECLEVQAGTLSKWKIRNSLPIELACVFAHRHNVSLDWLILGKESPTLGEMETELLARVAKLDFKQKLKLLNSLENGDFAKNSENSTASVNQTISKSTAGNIAGGNIQQGARFYFEDDE